MGLGLNPLRGGDEGDSGQRFILELVMLNTCLNLVGVAIGLFGLLHVFASALPVPFGPSRGDWQLAAAGWAMVAVGSGLYLYTLFFGF